MVTKLKDVENLNDVMKKAAVREHLQELSWEMNHRNNVEDKICLSWKSNFYIRDIFEEQRDSV